MWVSGLIICYGLRKKEQLRARLASNGQVWTAHENAARELMSLELEDMQQHVDKMSNEELAQVAMRMMEVGAGVCGGRRPCGMRPCLLTERVVRTVSHTRARVVRSLQHRTVPCCAPCLRKAPPDGCRVAATVLLCCRARRSRSS